MRITSHNQAPLKNQPNFKAKVEFDIPVKFLENLESDNAHLSSLHSAIMYLKALAPKIGTDKDTLKLSTLYYNDKHLSLFFNNENISQIGTSGSGGLYFSSIVDNLKKLLDEEQNTLKESFQNKKDSPKLKEKILDLITNNYLKPSPASKLPAMK